MQHNDLVTIYVTSKNLEEAKKIITSLLNKKMIACANILGEIDSFYEWKGKVCNEKEIAFILKTQSIHFSIIEKEIKRLHSYECPCIISLPINLGNKDFLDWIKNETS